MSLSPWLEIGRLGDWAIDNVDLWDGDKGGVMAAEWVRVQFVGDGPVTVLGATWYPGEVHEAPAAAVAQVAAERGEGWFVRVDGDANPVEDAAAGAEGVTGVTVEKKRSRK